MSVLREFRCLAHSAFESREEKPRCPVAGCSTVIREFRTAPAGRSEKTKISDKALLRLAERYKLTDMSNKNGSVGNSRNHPQGMEPVWAPLPAGNVFEVGKGEVQRDGATGGATAALAAAGMTGSVADALSKKLGRPVEAEPTFMEISKGLPRVRPHIVKEYGSQADLDSAIKSAS